MASWLNHVTISAPRNGTTSHTVSPSSGTVAAGSLFTPTAGNLLVVVVEGAVTSSTPSGWTLPAGGSAVNNTGLYVWYITAAGGDSLTTTHNGSNYPLAFDFYEFPAGSSFVNAASAVGVSSAGGAGPTLSGLTGTNWIAGAVGEDSFGASATMVSTWSAGVKAVDSYVASSPTDGYEYSLTYVEDSTATSAAYTVDITNSATSVERLMFAVNVAAGLRDLDLTMTLDGNRISLTLEGNRLGAALADDRIAAVLEST